MDISGAPANTRTQWQMDDGQLTLDVPRAGFSMSEFGPPTIMAIIAAILGAGAFACFLILIARRADVAPGFKWLTGLPFAIACFMLPGVILFQGILWPACCRTRVIASAGGLRVERRLGFLQRAKEMRADADRGTGADAAPRAGDYRARQESRNPVRTGTAGSRARVDSRLAGESPGEVTRRTLTAVPRPGIIWGR